MHNFSSTSSAETRVASLDLCRVWDVDEGMRYDNIRGDRTWDGERWTRPPQPGATPLVAVRTVAGLGEISTESGEVYELAGGSLLVMPWDQINRWRTREQRWRMYWFAFFADHVEHFQPFVPLSIPIRDAEQNEITEIIRLLRRTREAQRRLAAARLTALLYGWVSHHELEAERQVPHRSRVERAIDLMHDKLDYNLTVSEIAEAVDLNPRTFATVFERVTGQPPKRYFITLRLEAARAMLSTGQHSVQQTAERLRFSSPFHLSKAYKQHFGYPPSQTG